MSRFPAEEREIYVFRGPAPSARIFGKMKARGAIVRDFIIPTDDRDMGTPAKASARLFR
jgi:hypothetical protein